MRKQKYPKKGADACLHISHEKIQRLKWPDDRPLYLLLTHITGFNNPPFINVLFNEMIKTFGIKYKYGIDNFLIIKR